MKKLIPLMCLGLFALTSCKKETSVETSSNDRQLEQELQHWQIRTEDEIEKRQVAESEKLTSISRAQTLEKVVIVTGVAALAFLLLGGAMGSIAKKATNDVLES